MYAANPFNPYIISSLKLLISSFSVAKTPTCEAFSIISSLVVAVQVAHPLKSDPTGFPPLACTLSFNSSLATKVSLTLFSIALKSKFALVIVINKLSIIILFTFLSTMPTFLPSLATVANPLVTKIKRSCIFATSSVFPQTPLTVQPLHPAVS